MAHFGFAAFYGDQARVGAYSPKQEESLLSLRELLQSGALARLENKEESTYEIYEADRSYYAILAIAGEFAGLLSSWSPDEPPREVSVPDEI